MYVTDTEGLCSYVMKSSTAGSPCEWRFTTFLVVIPFREAKRVVRTSGVQLPLWPFDLEIRVIYRNFPTLTSPSALINFLTGLVEVGIAYDLPQGT
jgi:hypothetical protein